MFTRVRTDYYIEVNNSIIDYLFFKFIDKEVGSIAKGFYYYDEKHFVCRRKEFKDIIDMLCKIKASVKNYGNIMNYINYMKCVYKFDDLTDDIVINLNEICEETLTHAVYSDFIDILNKEIERTGKELYFTYSGLFVCDAECIDILIDFYKENGKKQKKMIQMLNRIKRDNDCSSLIKF
jgi:hypothetical protein